MLSFEKDLLVSFNQKQEAEADLFGIDILFPTGYSKCASINFGKDLHPMKEKVMLLEIFLDLTHILKLELFVLKII